MLSEIDCSLECLGEIAKRHSFVDNKTGTLHSACEKLIEDQVQLNVDSLEVYFYYYVHVYVFNYRKYFFLYTFKIMSKCT